MNINFSQCSTSQRPTTSDRQIAGSLDMSLVASIAGPALLGTPLGTPLRLMWHLCHWGRGRDLQTLSGKIQRWGDGKILSHHVFFFIISMCITTGINILKSKFLTPLPSTGIMMSCSNYYTLPSLVLTRVETYSISNSKIFQLQQLPITQVKYLRSLAIQSNIKWDNIYNYEDFIKTRHFANNFVYCQQEKHYHYLYFVLINKQISFLIWLLFSRYS